MNLDIDPAHDCVRMEGICLCCHQTAPEVQGRTLLCAECREERRRLGYRRSDRLRTTRAARRRRQPIQEAA